MNQTYFNYFEEVSFPILQRLRNIVPRDWAAYVNNSSAKFNDSNQGEVEEVERFVPEENKNLIR